MKQLMVIIAVVLTALLGAIPVWPAGGQGLMGVVQIVDLVSKTVGIKAGRQVIVFDVRNARLKGYGSLGEVSRGDTVTVVYTVQGVRITKIQAGEAVAPVSAKAKSGRMRRLVTGERGHSFEDADENNDGRISPVELSTVVPDLTLERFRDHDKDGDGYLNRREFEGVWKGP
jgi:hypothetical protein